MAVGAIPLEVVKIKGLKVPLTISQVCKLLSASIAIEIDSIPVQQKACHW